MLEPQRSLVNYIWGGQCQSGMYKGWVTQDKTFYEQIVGHEWVAYMQLGPLITIINQTSAQMDAP